MMRYRYCGLVIDSDLCLPELPAATVPDAPTDLCIVLAAVPHTLAVPTQRTDTYEIGRGEALWRLDGVGRYRVGAAGRRIEVEPAPRADAASVRLFLLQSVFALASVMRGDWMLNAAAVARDGMVTALIGPSASGKSTTAALLLKRGWHLVSDSLLRVAATADGSLLAHPQAHWLHLWPDAIEHLGFDSAAGAAARPGIALRRLDFPVIEQPLPLARIAILREQKGDDLEMFDAESRRGASAFETLLHSCAGNPWMEALAARHALFCWGAQIAKQAAVEKLEVPWGWNRMDTLGAELASWCGRKAKIGAVAPQPIRG